MADRNRRNFLKKGSIATASILGMGVISPSCSPYAYGTFYMEKDRIRIPKAEFEKKAFVMIQPAGLSAPVLINKVDENKYRALLMECTHKQCTVSMSGKTLVCPCHGSEFSLEGKVLKSPAEKDLLEFKVTEDESNIYLN